MREITTYDINTCREAWEEVARTNNWKHDWNTALPIQIWIDEEGLIRDVVSHLGLKDDIVCDYETDEVLDKDKYEIV